MTVSQAIGARLTPGDPMPRLVLLDRTGSRFDFQHQSIAGDTLVLWLTAEPVTPDRLAAFEAIVEELTTVAARPFVIAMEPPPSGKRLETSVPVLLDPERRLGPALGLSGAGILVIDPRGRISVVLPGDAFSAALAHCRTLHGTGIPLVRRSGAPVLIVPEVVEPELRLRLIAYWREGEKLNDLVASAKGAQDGQAATKKRSDVMIKDKAIFELLKNSLLMRLIPELKRAFGFEVASFEALRIGCYDAAAGGFFRRHRDNSTPYTVHRSFAMSLNLNTGEYVGGQIRFPEFGRDLYEAEAGGAVVFSCNLLHEALPVTRGRRFAVFTFFADTAGAARERQLVEKQLQAGRQGVTIG